MAELAEAYGAVVRSTAKATLTPLREERANYLKYLAQRTEAGGPANAYQELVELTDRGLMDTEDLVLDGLVIQGEYNHNFQQTTGGQGEIAVAVGPAKISVGGSLDRTEGSTSNLRLTATYKTRSRAEFLEAALATLPTKPVAAAPPATPNP